MQPPLLNLVLPTAVVMTQREATGTDSIIGSDSGHRVGDAERMVIAAGKRGLSPIYLNGETGQASAAARLRGRKRIVFGWYGGKFSHLEWLLPLLPEAHHYCEPFAGSGAVLINRAPAPVETYNDIDGDVVNFFRVLREDPEGLSRQISLTPFSREEFYIAVSPVENGLPALERARRF